MVAQGAGKKKKKKEEYKKRGLDLKRKGMQASHGVDYIGDPFAKKQKFKLAGAAASKPPLPLRSEITCSSQGTTMEPILIEEAEGPECCKCSRAGHYPNQCTFKPLCVVCTQEGHTSAQCPSHGKPPLHQTMGHAISGEGFFCLQ